jgi:hypothetical protein
MRGDDSSCVQPSGKLLIVRATVLSTRLSGMVASSMSATATGNTNGARSAAVRPAPSLDIVMSVRDPPLICPVW